MEDMNLTVAEAVEQTAQGLLTDDASAVEEISIEELVTNLTEQDTVLFLLSGGGSALFEALSAYLEAPTADNRVAASKVFAGYWAAEYALSGPAAESGES